MHSAGYSAALLQLPERKISLGGQSWVCCLSRQRQTEQMLPLGSSMKRLSTFNTALLPYTLIVAPCISGRDNLQADAGHCNSARQTGGSRPHNEAGCEYDVHNQLVSTERRTLDAICEQHLTNRGMQLAVHIRLLQ